MNLQQAFDMQLRNDPVSFLHRCFQTINPGAKFHDNWHIEAIAEKLAGVQRGDIRRLIINIAATLLEILDGLCRVSGSRARTQSPGQDLRDQLRR